MRRSDREVTDPREIAGILSRCRVCRLALTTGGAPYVVPLSFGFSLEGGALTLYFHSAKAGRKIDLIAENPAVGFEIGREIALIEGGTACKYGCAFESVIGTGRARILTDAAEKCEALARLMRCQTGRAFSFHEAEAESVAVIALTAQTYTAKSRPLPG